MNEEINNKIRLLDAHKRRLQILEIRSATLGLTADPSTIIEIEDITKTISNLESEITNLTTAIKKSSRLHHTRYVIKSNISTDINSIIQNLEAITHNSEGTDISHCLIFFDIDRLEGITKAFGNTTGDKVTSTIESIVKSYHSSNFVSRWEGDEFIIAIKDISIQNAIDVANKLRLQISRYKWHTIAEHLYVTASFGVSCLKPHESRTEWLVRTIIGCKIAKIKQNRVCLAPDIISKTSSQNPLDYIS